VASPLNHRINRWAGLEPGLEPRGAAGYKAGVSQTNSRQACPNNMKTSFLSSILLIASFAFAASGRAETPDAAERKKLDGIWVGGVKGGGGRGPAGKGKGGGQGYMVNITELTIKDGKITAKGDRDSNFGSGTYTLNLGTNPRTLDATGLTGRSAGKTHLGIYRWSGDTLEWCVSNPGIDRPKDFFTTPQVQFHMVLTRKKS
jgi:uncharacterized protein (TIGR03067 family)